MSGLRAQFLCNTPLLKGYIKNAFRDFHNRFEEISREFALTMEMWNQDTIESVEFMELRERLGDAWIKRKSVSVLRLRQRQKWRDAALLRFRRLPLSGPPLPSTLQRAAHKVAKQFGYQGYVFSGLAWIEEHVRDMSLG